MHALKWSALPRTKGPLKWTLSTPEQRFSARTSAASELIPRIGCRTIRADSIRAANPLKVTATTLITGNDRRIIAIASSMACDAVVPRIPLA